MNKKFIALPRKYTRARVFLGRRALMRSFGAAVCVCVC